MTAEEIAEESRAQLVGSPSKHQMWKIFLICGLLCVLVVEYRVYVVLLG